MPRGKGEKSREKATHKLSYETHIMCEPAKAKGRRLHEKGFPRICYRNQAKAWT